MNRWCLRLTTGCLLYTSTSSASRATYPSTSRRRRTSATSCWCTPGSPCLLYTSLGELVERGLIESHGTGRATTYLLSARVYRETGHALGYVRQKGIDDVRHPELVMELARVQGSLMRSDVAELLRVSPSKAGSIIKEMTASGKLRLEGHGRGARYYPAAPDGERRESAI